MKPSASTVNKRYLEERNGVTYNVFKRAGETSSLSYVKNSGICETTPGVDQYSGYLDVGTNMHKHGPCHFVDGSSKPSLNQYSWNTYANMLYVDQPIGTGFSYGDDEATSTVSAAAYVWTFLQNFYAAFPEYENRDFGLWTESYGGHYGPEFASYFEAQNAKIAAGTLTGEKVNLVALGINNGWIDPVLQYQAYPIFAYNNTYKQLISASQYQSYMSAYTKKCVPALASCTGLTGNNNACLSGDSTCRSAVETPIENANDFNVYDVLEPSSSQSTDPPETYVDYLQSKSVMTAIGAQTTYGECPDTPYDKMVGSGDVWAGDLDWICNWYGSQLVVNSINYTDSAAFQSAKLAEYTVGGKSHGQFKTAGNLNFLRVYEAGHEVPYYQPAAALQAFTQIMQGKALLST
ncbi:putative carboxypeptidase s1 [Diaporthe ampelina]|uniref:Carboxypeptidase n=1 Tax=Diaporthe ampelina TaxID=1214573 RepID=A0A0G2HP39_9PEZI|nr:putative carboxypeptidase s1 [Diaporthe ampelina]